MKILTYGAIATALVIGTMGSVANAGEYRDHRAGGHKVERNYKHDRGRAVHVERRVHRKDYGKHYGHRPHHRTYRGHGPRAHWKWYKRHRHGNRHARHHYKRHHGHGHHRPHRVVIGGHHHHHSNAGAVVAGSIIGGIIANEVSGGDRGAAAVGAVMGAVIAADATKHRQPVRVVRRHHR